MFKTLRMVEDAMLKDLIASNIATVRAFIRWLERCRRPARTRIARRRKTAGFGLSLARRGAARLGAARLGKARQG